MKKNKIYLIIFIFISIFSHADEVGYGYDRNFSLRNSAHAVVALKIGGRIDCNASNSYPNVGFDKKCSGTKVTEEMKTYNFQKKTEDFLILKSLKGEKKQGDIVTVRFRHDTSDFGHMNIGSVYLIFFHQKGDEFYYEYCDVVDYKKIKKIIDKNIPFEKMVDVLLAKDISICPSFEST